MNRWLLAAVALVALGAVAYVVTAPSRCRAAAERGCAGHVADLEAGVFRCSYTCAGTDPWQD